MTLTWPFGLIGEVFLRDRAPQIKSYGRRAGPADTSHAYGASKRLNLGGADCLTLCEATAIAKMWIEHSPPHLYKIALPNFGPESLI